MRFKSFIPAIIWFIITAVLLAMPGDDLPKSELFNIPFFDKYVHFVMFFLLVALFCLPFSRKRIPLPAWKTASLQITIAVICYGIAMEFVQKYFVPGRSFDVVDILSDTVGSIGGLWGMYKVFWLQKNRPR